MESRSAGFCRQFATTYARLRRSLSNPRNSDPAKLQRLCPISLLKYAHLPIACHAVAQRRRVDRVGLTGDVIRKRTPHAVEHSTRLILRALKIGAQSLSQPVQRSMFLAIFVARFLFVFAVPTLTRLFGRRLHVLHR